MDPIIWRAKCHKFDFLDDGLMRLTRRWLACHEAIGAVTPNPSEPEHVAHRKATLRERHYGFSSITPTTMSSPWSHGGGLCSRRQSPHFGQPFEQHKFNLELASQMRELHLWLFGRYEGNSAEV